MSETLSAVKLPQITGDLVVALINDNVDKDTAEVTAKKITDYCATKGYRNGQTVLSAISGKEEAVATAAAVTDGDIIMLRNMLAKIGKPAETTTQQQPLPPAQPFPILQSPSAVPLFTLPDVPNDTNFLESLKTSATLTVDITNIAAVMRAHFANEMGLALIPEMISEAMERFADNTEVPVTTEFLEVLELVNEKKYADVNIKSKYVTVARKRQVLDRMRELRTTLANFQAELNSWNERLKANRQADPLARISGLNVYPPHDDVVGAAESVVSFFNRGLAGYGPIVARALAYEAMKIREFLDKPSLPALTGFATKELMLKAFKIGVTSADVRLEKNVARYATYVVTKVATGDLPPGQEGSALEALWNLGNQILGWLQNGRINDGGRPIEPNSFAAPSRPAYAPRNNTSGTAFRGGSRGQQE